MALQGGTQLGSARRPRAHGGAAGRTHDAITPLRTASRPRCVQLPLAELLARPSPTSVVPKRPPLRQEALPLLQAGERVAADERADAARTPGGLRGCAGGAVRARACLGRGAAEKHGGDARHARAVEREPFRATSRNGGTARTTLTRHAGSVSPGPGLTWPVVSLCFHVQVLYAPGQPSPQESIDSIPVIPVAGHMAICDGGGGALGHPIEYIQLNTRHHDPATCKYCGLRFVSTGGGHH